MDQPTSMVSGHSEESRDSGPGETGGEPADEVGRLPGIVLAVPAVATAAILGIQLGSRQFWQDELATWWASSLSTEDFWRLMSTNDVVFLPYYLVMRGWVTLFGASGASLRLPSLLGMVLAAALVTLLGRRLYGDRVGLVSGLVFAVLPAVSRYGQEARPYAFIVAGATGATLLLLLATQRPTLPRWAAYTAAVAVTLCLHPAAVLLLLAHGVWAARGRAHGRAWLAATAVALVPAGTLAVFSWPQRWQVSWIDTTWFSALVLPADMLGSYAVALPLIALAGVAVARHRRTQRNTLALLIAWGAAPLLVIYALIPVLDLGLARYVLFAIPAWSILAGRAIADIRRPRNAVLVGAALVLLCVPDQVIVRRNPSWSPDFRSVAQTISARATAGEAIAYQDVSWRQRLALTYELGPTLRGLRDVFLQIAPGRAGTYAAVECAHPAACAADVRRIWFVTETESDPLADLPAWKEDFLRREFTVASVDQFNQVRLVRLDRR